jgi:hypothetical protein
MNKLLFLINFFQFFLLNYNIYDKFLNVKNVF